MEAIVLAAGEGKRLQPLTFTRPKHMIKIGGKPLLEHILLSIRESGIDDIIIVVNYKNEKIKEYFSNGSNINLKIKYILQGNPKGTAHAFGLAEKFVKGPFLAINGDLLVNPEAIKTVLKTNEETNPAATIAIVQVKNPRDYGVVETRGKVVKEIVEKPTKSSKSNLINAGVYVFSEEIFKAIKLTKESLRGEREITDSLQILIETGRKVTGARIRNKDWLDVGKPWDILEANKRVLDNLEPISLGKIENGAYLIGPVFIGEEARVRSGAYIEGPTFIGEGSDIGPNCHIRPYTSIGSHCRIGNACEVKNSLIMDNVHIGHLSYIGDSMIGEGCIIGAGTLTANLRFDNKTIKMSINGKILDSGKEKLGVVMGDYVKTGIGALIMPGVKIGCKAKIDANKVVQRDIL